MRISSRLTALVAISVLAASAAEISPTKADLEGFERFIASPTARIVWAGEIGRIETDQGRASISALMVADTSQTARTMRGIRIDLADGQVEDRLYTSEVHLDRLIDTMREIDASVPSNFNGTGGCRGSGVFLLEVRQDVHAFSASECDSGDWAGLTIGPGNIRFTGKSAGDFVRLFQAARDELSRQLP